MLELVTPAPNRGLLTIEELRAAAGVTDASQDAELIALGLRISDMIAIECAVARAGMAPPTLLQETLRERIDDCGATTMFLARRFVVIETLEERGIPLSAVSFDVDAGSGELRRRWDKQAGYWAGPTVVTYRAGFASDQVPASLKDAAIVTLREMRSAASRDPLLRSETVEGAGRFDYQVGGSSRGSSALPLAVLAILDAFRTTHLV